MRFYYTEEEPENRAGILFLGHAVIPSMIVPPRADNYTIAGLCSSICTDRVRFTVLINQGCRKGGAGGARAPSIF